MPNRISKALLLTVVIAIVVLFAASAAYSSCAITIEPKNKRQTGDTITIETVFNASGQQYFPCSLTDGDPYECPYKDEGYIVAAWTIDSNTTLSSLYLTFPTGILQVADNGQPLNYVTEPNGQHFCPAGDTNCEFPSLVYDTLEISYNAIPERLIVWFKLDSTAQVQSSQGQLLASSSGGLYFCEGEFSVPSLASASGIRTTEQIKAVVQEYNGRKDTVCIRTLKDATQICPPPDQIYYACLPASGDCNDVVDGDWCPFIPVTDDTGKPLKAEAIRSQYAGTPECPNGIVAAENAAFVLCGPDAAYYSGTCLGGSGPPVVTGMLGNPCTPLTPPPPTGYGGCIECTAGGYGGCICW